MNSGFYPQVVNPNIRKVQTMSGGFQKPFYFGGSYVPIDLSLPSSSFSGSGLKPTSKSIVEGEPIQQHKGKLTIKAHTMPHIGSGLKYSIVEGEMKKNRRY